MLGQPASWQTVCRPSRWTRPRSWVNSGPIVALTLIQSGLRSIGVSALRASTRSRRRPSGATMVTSQRLRSLPLRKHGTVSTATPRFSVAAPGEGVLSCTPTATTSAVAGVTPGTDLLRAAGKRAARPVEPRRIDPRHTDREAAAGDGGGEGAVVPRGSRSPAPPWGSRCDDQGGREMQRILSDQLRAHIGARVTIAGWLHRRRMLKSVSFLILRDRAGFAQVVTTAAALEGLS